MIQKMGMNIFSDNFFPETEKKISFLVCTLVVMQSHLFPPRCHCLLEVIQCSHVCCKVGSMDHATHS